MHGTDDDPKMPKRPPLGALRAIEQIRSYRSWAAIDMYLEIRDPRVRPRDRTARRV